MKLTILGTGNAVVTRCYNTCFIFDDNGKYFLVDGGGGNGILRQLEDANIPWKEIRDIFITHKHLDHLTGIIWMILSLIGLNPVVSRSKTTYMSSSDCPFSFTATSVRSSTRYPSTP